MTVKPSSVLQPVEKLRREVSVCDEINQVHAGAHLLIGVHAASDPLLSPIDDPVLPILCLLGVGVEAEHVRSSMSLGDGETNEFLSGEDFGEHFPLQFFRAEVHDGRETDDKATHDTCVILFSRGRVGIPENPHRHHSHGRRNGRVLER